MALSDLISRPIAAPLEGFDKAVGVGFELAQQQDRLRIANEELKIKQQEIQDTFMTKGLNMMSILPKLKGKKEKTFYLGLMKTYFEKSGFDKGKIENLFAQMNADEEFALGVSDRVSTLNSLYPPTSVENIQKQKLEWSKFQDLDEEQRKNQIESLNAQEKALLAQQTLAVTTKELEKRGFTQELTKSAAPMHVIERANQGDLGYANMWRMANDRIGQARTTLKDAKFIRPEDRRDIEAQLNRAAGMLMSPDSFQQGVMMSEAALARSGELVSVATGAQEEAKSKRAEAIQRAQESRFQRSQQAVQGRFEERQQEVRLSDTAKKVDNIVKNSFGSSDKIASAVKRLEEMLATNPTVADLKGALATFARTVQEEKGQLSDADVSRVFNRTIGSDLAGVRNYIFGSAKPPASLLQDVTRNLGRFKIANYEIAILKSIRELELAQKDKRLGSEFQPGGSGYDQIIGTINSTIRSSGLNLRGKSMNAKSTEENIRKSLKQNKGETPDQFEKRIQSTLQREIFSNLENFIPVVM